MKGGKIMLGSNILELRKKKGLSQEELSEKVGVTRQTISNWELNETQPNPEQLKLLSKALNVSVDELIDNDIKNALIEKTIRTEANSNQALKIVKLILWFILGLIVSIILIAILFAVKPGSKDARKSNSDTNVTQLKCSIDNKTYSYLIESDKDNNIIEHSGSEYIANIVKDKEFKKGKMLAQYIISYFKDNNGSC
jgi:transcriptional regulator with XRE-family HTH domain